MQNDKEEIEKIERVEVFLFTGGVKALEKGKDNSEVLDAISELRESGIVVEACSNQVKNWNMEDVFSENGINLEDFSCRDIKPDSP